MSITRLAKQDVFDTYETYEGNDLGFSYTKDATSFRLWAPSAKKVELKLYDSGDGDCSSKIYSMKADKGGTFFTTVERDCNGLYYTYLVSFEDHETETADPYAKAVGVNGKRSMVVDLTKTNPKGFREDNGPQLVSYTDAIIYEVSIADITGDENSGVKNKGKYLGLTEEGTVCPAGYATGLDHIKDLGVTHVQLMPVYDFGSVDETKPFGEEYNWGYDPVNYFVPEGSYSTDPYHGEVRIKEFKSMVKSFHDAGIGVIMDVVFNHTYDIENSVFQKTVPDYFYRKHGEAYSDASACGNEVASERTMCRKYIVDCVCYWAKEYHIDGFRFDLMGVLDIETMNKVVSELIKINPFIMIYGEGWTGGASTLPDEMRALKVNCDAMENVAMFSDDIRDGIRGDVFIATDTGFATGKGAMENSIRYSVVGAVKHNQINYKHYSYTESGAWAATPADTINYISCHDNLTLWDKIKVTCPNEDIATRKKRNLLAATIVMTSQGVPFMLSGEEFCRSKEFPETGEVCENSYNQPLSINSLKYQDLVENCDVYEFYKGLIRIRKKHVGFRMANGASVQRFLRFQNVHKMNVVAYTIETQSERIYVAYNANYEEIVTSLPTTGEWDVLLKDNKVGDIPIGIVSRSVMIEPLSAFIAVQEK